jgi:hypothetical protein
VQAPTSAETSTAPLTRDVISPFYKGKESIKVEARSIVVLRSVEQNGNGSSAH